VVDASLGGPVTELFGAPVPLPLTTLGATVGVTDTVDVHAAVHPSAIALFGLAAGDAGASVQLLAPTGARPRLMTDLTLVGAGGDVDPAGSEGGFRLFARPTLNASWDWGRQKRSTFYAGIGGFIQPFPTVHALGTVAVGNRWGLSKRTTLTTQVEWIAPYASSEMLAPHYYAPGNLGAISFQLGLSVWAAGGAP
jgi:hypothetical protein